GIPGARREDGVQDGQDRGPEEGPRLRGSLRPFRLQGTPPHGGAAVRGDRRGAETNQGWSDAKGRRFSGQPLGRAAGGGKPDSRSGADEGLRSLLAAEGRGWEEASEEGGRKRPGPGVGGFTPGGHRHHDEALGMEGTTLWTPGSEVIERANITKYTRWLEE